MSVGKIALGVFLGNLGFALLMWIVIGVVVDRQAAKASLDQAQAQYRALQSSEQPSSAPMPAR